MSQPETEDEERAGIQDANGVTRPKVVDLWKRRLVEAVDGQQFSAAQDALGALIRATNGQTVEADNVSTVLSQWAAEGPLMHELLGFPELDRLTDGGPVYGTRWTILGAPDAGKTAWALQVGETFARRGIAVGILAVDEEGGDLVTRLAQRNGVSRRECEERAPETLTRIALALEALPIKFYDADWTIESAAADLHHFATDNGMRAALFVDSLQTVPSAVEDPSRSLREVVTARAKAIRAVATRYRMIAIATSEMARGAYRSKDSAEQTNDMAAGKESGSIEYQARVVLALRSVPGEKDLIELKVVKNKHGPRDEKVYLRLDRGRQILTEEDEPDLPDPAEGREAARIAAQRKKVRHDAAGVVRLLALDPGLTKNKLIAAGRLALGGFSQARADAALKYLGSAVATRPAANRALAHYVVGAQLPEDVLADMAPDDRARAAGLMPPTEGS